MLRVLFLESDTASIAQMYFGVSSNLPVKYYTSSGYLYQCLKFERYAIFNDMNEMLALVTPDVAQYVESNIYRKNYKNETKKIKIE